MHSLHTFFGHLDIVDANDRTAVMENLLCNLLSAPNSH